MNLRGMKNFTEKIRGMNFFSKKVRGTKKIRFLGKSTPGGYPALIMSTPLDTMPLRKQDLRVRRTTKNSSKRRGTVLDRIFLGFFELT